MARESQGLQIALISFVLLIVVLAVTTFLGWKEAGEADQRAVAAEATADKNQKARDTFYNESVELKKMLGYADSHELQEISTDFDNDMKLEFGGNFPEDKHNYRFMMTSMYEVITQTNETLATTDQKLKEANSRNQSLEAAKQAQITAAEAELKKAQADRDSEKQKFDAALAQHTKDKEALAAALDKARKDADAAIAKKDSELQAMAKQLTLARAQRDRLVEEVRDLQPETPFEVAHGEVRWVDQRKGTVYIDLGRADSLARQTSFAVYSADISDVTKAGKKASIQVTQVVGDHLSEARILDDDPSNPILPGDKVHTPVWAPGQKRHFALVGFLDMDGDGKSDLTKLEALIAANGGVVDAVVDEGGNRRGKVTINTRYYVLGTAPDEKAPPAAEREFSKIITEADQLGIEKIMLADLLGNMGWKNLFPVQRFGREARPEDYRPLPPAGLPKVSTGTVSGLFKPRRPPVRSRDGAY